jgi:hypothetical protein
MALSEKIYGTGASFIPFRRAVLMLLDRWATHGTPPPPSLLPKAADGTLVTAEEVLAKYPKLQGVNLPAVTRVCEERVREGLMLQEDADRFIAAARQKNPLDASVRLGPLIQAGAYTGR